MYPSSEPTSAIATAKKVLSLRALENKVSELFAKTAPCFSYPPKNRPVGVDQGDDHPCPKNYDNWSGFDPEKKQET
jgi:hypothetical protein